MIIQSVSHMWRKISFLLLENWRGAAVEKRNSRHLTHWQSTGRCLDKMCQKKKEKEKKKHVSKAAQINDSLARSHSLHLQSYRPRQLPSKNIWIYLMEWKIGGNVESDPRGFLSPLYSFHIFNTGASTTLPCESANTLMHITQLKGCHFRILI